jgi:peptidyl-prolyl cis-trans isomerase A (cyclophilin A)
MHRRTVLAALAAAVAGPALAQAPAPPTAAPTPAPIPPPAPGMVRVKMTTGQGVILIDLNAGKAPLTVANFLRYLDAGRYNRSTIYRAVTVPNAPQLGLVQGGAGPAAGKQIPPVMHESTTKTGLLHTAGTISLGRTTLNSGTSDFFICVGDAPYLDAKPDGPPGQDNEGFAAFGQVVEGMEVVRKILVLPTSQEAENPAMKGQMLDPPVPILSTVRVA